MPFIVIVAIIISSVVGLKAADSVFHKEANKPVEVIQTSTPTPSSTQQVLPQSTQNTNYFLIDCVGPDGKQFKTTQKECDEFNSAWRNNKNTQQINPPPQATRNVTPPSTKSTTQSNLIDCNTKMGTFKLTDFECSEYNRILSQYVECYTAFYHYSWVTPEECEQYKIQDAAFINKLNNIANPQPTPTPDNSYNQQQNSQCKMYANNWYTNQGTQCSGSCAEAIKQLAYPEYQAKLAECDRLYPIS